MGTSFPLLVLAIWCLLLPVVLAIVTNVIFRNQFAHVEPEMEQSGAMSDSVWDLVGAVLQMTIYGGEMTGMIDEELLISDEYPDEEPMIALDRESIGQDWLDQLMTSGARLDDFQASLSVQAAAGLDLMEGAPVLMTATVPFRPCRKGIPESSHRNISFQGALAFMYWNLEYVRDREPGQHWAWYQWSRAPEPPDVTDAFCNIVSLASEFNDWGQMARDGASERTRRSFTSDRDVGKRGLKTAGPLYGAFMMVPLVVVGIATIFEFRTMTNAIATLPQESKDAGLLPVRADTHAPVTEMAAHPPPTRDSLMTAIAVAALIAGAGAVVCTCAVFIAMVSAADAFIPSASHLEDVSIIQPQVIGAMTSLLRLVMVANDRPGLVELGEFSGTPYAAHNLTKAFDVSLEAAQFDRRLDDIDARLGLLMAGDEVTPSILGLVPEIDELLTQDMCETDMNSPSIHEQFRCASMAMQLQVMIDYLTRARDMVLPNSNGQFEDERLLAAMHLLFFHFLPAAEVLEQMILWDVPAARIGRYKSQCTVALVVQLFCAVLLFALITTLRRMANSTYRGFLSLVRRLPPEAVVLHQPLLRCIMGGRSKADRARADTVAAAVINAMKDPVIFTNRHHMIEYVSPSVRIVFDETPEQLLGQPLSSLFLGEDQMKVLTQLELMRDGEAPRTYKEVLACVKGEGQALQCVTTILMIRSAAEKSDVFAVIFRDQSELLAGQEAAAAAKERSDELLNEILPRAVVQRLTLGETDISFVVESATLMFVDIQKFSEYTASLAPQTIFANLNRIFQGYDACIGSYPLLRKMKFVGDVYMVAGGLFDPSVEPARHAEQMVRFAQNCLGVIEDTNTVLTIALSVRIGINSGGPLVAGVLGTDKPLFDILGDTINIAARLQSTDVPGKIQISESTYHLTRSCTGFTFESRGMVQLKGKGPRPAFFVKVDVPTPDLSRQHVPSILMSGSDFSAAALGINRMLGASGLASAFFSPLTNV